MSPTKMLQASGSQARTKWFTVVCLSLDRGQMRLEQKKWNEHRNIKSVNFRRKLFHFGHTRKENGSPAEQNTETGPWTVELFWWRRGQTTSQLPSGWSLIDVETKTENAGRVDRTLSLDITIPGNIRTLNLRKSRLSCCKQETAFSCAQIFWSNILLAEHWASVPTEQILQMGHKLNSKGQRVVIAVNMLVVES